MKKYLFSLFVLSVLGLSASAQDTDIFLKAIEAEFELIDMDQDDAGNTYVLGRRAANSVIKKFDASGLIAAEVEISGLNPVSFDVASNGFVYVASSQKIRRLSAEDLALDDAIYEIPPTEFLNIPLSTSLRDLVYVPATDKLVIGGQAWWSSYGSPVILQTGADLMSGTAVTWISELEFGSASVRSLTVDDQGSVYMVGKDKLIFGYVVRLATNGTYAYKQLAEYWELFDVTYRNGWVYLLGKVSLFSVPYLPDGVNFTEVVRVSRLDTNLSPIDESFVITNGGYSSLATSSDTNKKKFSLVADDLDNLYVTGYAPAGTTKFYAGDKGEFRSIANASESAYVAKLDFQFEYQWIKSPMLGPLPDFGTNLKLAWDAQNTRLWWSGSYSGADPLGMQEGSDASSLMTLPQDDITQGFVAVFEQDGAFTEIVDFTLLTQYAENRVKLNDKPFGTEGRTEALILNSVINIQTPRTVYQWHTADGSVEETDNIDSDDNIISNSDTRFTFINFSVNNVVEDSDATVYTFSLQEQTTVELEWLVEYALEVNSDFQDTASRATQEDGSLYVEALSSAASGNPTPATGKHWIEEDSPVVLQINGAAEDVSSHPGLFIRYVPFAYTATGAFAAQVTDAGVFHNVESRQQLDEFSMAGPTAITYAWKLQYGIEIKTTQLSADALMLVDFLQNPDETTIGQQDAQGAGIHWYDDGTLVRIAAPRTLTLNDGPKSLEGWINGDNVIFRPTEDSFDTSSDSPFTQSQMDEGFLTFDYDGEEYIGKEVILERPARVIWNYGDSSIQKTVSIGSPVEFTPEEIFNFSLDTSRQPTLSADGVDLSSGGDDLPTASDYVWDAVAHRFYPVRPVEMDLLWPTSNENPAKVIVTPEWGPVHYQHIADSPPVSLTSHPPEGEPDDLVFQSLAYTEGDAAVDDDRLFTATEVGKSVLRFDRMTASGRGGTAQSVVELKVVETKLWNSELGPVSDAVIGRKITSDADLAGLETGYVFFENARYNPFIYNRSLFSGESLWDEDNPPGPVVPVNRNPTASEDSNDEFVVVWYDDPALNDHFLWPYKAVLYRPRWPVDPAEGLGRILISSGFGSESVDADGLDQEVVGGATTFDPARFEQVQIYNQPNKNEPGYNPNEEHALMAPSLRYADVAPRPDAAYAMRDNDLNITISNSSYTSDPYVLVQFLDRADGEYKMKVYLIVREDPVVYPDGFSAEMMAGEPVIPYYPLGVVSGASLCSSTYAREGDPHRRTFWKDHKDSAWAVSGDGSFSAFFYYPLSPDFWWPDDSKMVGDCVAWLPDFGTDLARESFEIDYTSPMETPQAQGVDYSTEWPTDLPILKAGETLTFAGGEYAADNPDAPGLPGVLAWAAGEVVYDDLNSDMREGFIDQDGKSFDNYTCRMISALESRTVDLPVENFPAGLLPATGRTKVVGTNYVFPELSSSLNKRIFYDPLNGKLGIKGLINDKDISDNTLTAAPPAVYVLEPNILTGAEYDELRGSGDSPFVDISGDSNWRLAVNALFERSGNPNQLSDSRIQSGEGYTVGLQSQDEVDSSTGLVTSTNNDAAQSFRALGPGLALITNPGFLDPNKMDELPDVSYVTLAENNDPSLGGSPVTLHVIKVDRRERYRGAVKIVLSDNVFDENIILRHSGDFGANAGDLVFDWWYRPEDGTDALPPDAIPAGVTNPWKLFADPSENDGKGFYQLKLKGNPQAPELLLADSLWFVRYRHKNEAPDDPISWNADPEIPYEWAGAGNSTPKDLDGNGLPDYRAQLAQGWVKRVLDAVNPYEARIRDFTGDNPATYASMIRQFGPRFEGPVALNPGKNVIENVGLIELYATILDRARDLSIDLSTPVSTPGITNALLLASTRLADFYMLLGNEAYTDALNPTIGYGSDSVEYGNLAPTVFTFQNQLSTPIEEELALLRGLYDFKARPVYNRLFWNFTKGEGEAAYATSYNISDVTQDGFINEDDAMVLYPQGHGDAWGHYLTALRGQYELLNNAYFNWVSRSELYSLQDIVFEVDFLDERKFAQVAAAKAKAGAEIVELTYRDRYVADPESQWQGYLDTDPKRAWGMEGWARRAGQGAYFDWVTANALLPSEHPNSSKTGIEKVDRTTVKDIAVISANMNAIQQSFEEANQGYNPLGLAGNTVPFDLDPTYLKVASLLQGETHFEQIYDRAEAALNNAIAVFDYANELNNSLRGIENNEIEFRRAVFEQDFAYRNELIEIFGTPYEGTMGSGKAYPAGYKGPDTSLYMYVDKQAREISADTVPRITQDFNKEVLAIKDKYGSFLGTGFRANYSPSFSQDDPADWFDEFGEVDYIVTEEEDGITFATEEARVPLENMQLPIKASGYTFEAEEDWGQRASPGQLQLHIASMIQQEAELAKAIADWDALQGGVVRQLRLISAQLEMDSTIRGKLGDKITNRLITGLATGIFNFGASLVENAVVIVNDSSEAASKFVPENTPTVGLANSLGDALSAVRAAFKTAAGLANVILLSTKTGLETLAEGSELTHSLIDLGIDKAIDSTERDFALKQALVELENLAVNEAILRVEVFRQQEALRALSDEYRALLQKGARLIDEREAYNKRVAELVQRNRYQDMSFRVARNAALQNYHEAFDLAARYIYLAAKAYDYETNLHPDDPGSAQGVLTDIVSKRNLGLVVDGEPRQGKGGLAELLAQLLANFRVIESRLGLNQPQAETGRFSLRRELFRIAPSNGSDASAASDAAWRDALEQAKVDNLWDLTEFRRYCRPFAAYDPDTSEPGLVIEFPSEITFKKNFFGRALAGGDNTYDPTVFSTKIFSAGVWFEGYLSSDFETGLSETPRVYLVPVGTDVMLYPSDDNLGVRLWNVLDQSIPVPHPVLQSSLDDHAWRPLDTLGGLEGEMRRFSSLRAYHDSGFFEESEMTFNTRLVGRSVWNTRWLLIIPGGTLHADADGGLDTFIQNISDIKLYFQTYGFSGN